MKGCLLPSKQAKMPPINPDYNEVEETKLTYQVCVCTCACVRACVYMSMCACVRACVLVCVFVCVHACVLVGGWVGGLHALMRVRVHLCLCMGACLFVCWCMCVSVRAYEHMYIYASEC